MPREDTSIPVRLVVVVVVHDDDNDGLDDTVHVMLDNK